MLLTKKCINKISDLAQNAETGSTVEAIWRRGFAGTTCAELVIDKASTNYTDARSSITQKKLEAAVDLLRILLQRNGNRILRPVKSVGFDKSEDKSIMTYESYVIEAS